MKPIIRIWHRLPISLRIYFAKAAYCAIRPFMVARIASWISNPPAKNDKVLILGLFNAKLGVSMAANLLYKDIHRSKISVTKYDVSEYLKQTEEQTDSTNNLPDLDSYTTLIIALNPEETIKVLNQLGKKWVRNKRIIGYWVWELENPPKTWKLMNEIVHEVWTPSEFSRRSIRRVINCNIKIIPHPVGILDGKTITKSSRNKSRAKLGLKNDAFIALQSFSFASSMSRKNILGAIDAFERAFPNASQNRLIIRYQGEDRYPKSFSRLTKRALNSKSNIVLICAENNLELLDYYHSSDVYISLHRSEGFGLNLAEAMSFGLPVIASNWSGNLEFMTQETCCLIGVKLTPVIDEDNIYSDRCQYWAEPSIEEASLALRSLAENLELRELLIAKAKKIVAKKLSGGEASAALLAHDTPMDQYTPAF